MKPTSFPRQTIVSKLAEKAIGRLIFPSDIEEQINKDVVSFHNLRRHLHFDETFHPIDHFYSFRFREAIMMQNIKHILSKIAMGGKPLTKPNSHEVKLDQNCVVAVIGKSHYFGLNQLWNDYKIGEKKFETKNKLSALDASIYSDDFVTSSEHNVIPKLGNSSQFNIQLSKKLQPDNQESLANISKRVYQYVEK